MTTDSLFQPLRAGDLELPHRVLMAPLTRSRSLQPGDVPHELNATYYAQRADAGLIVSEATQVSPQGKGYAFTPGIHSDEQVAGWRKVTDAVHAAGGRIFLQLWHVGRVSHTDLQEGGAQPVAPSAILAKTQTYVSADSGMVDVSPARALELEEIPGVVDQFRRGAQNAKAAGFDGVEVHGANGYLLDQFTRDGSNHRADVYGGSVENRIRFPLEVVDAVIEVWGAGRVGYRISPTGAFGDMADSDPKGTFTHLAAALGKRGIAYLHNVEAFGGQARDEAIITAVREAFGGVYIANGGYDGPTGAGRIDAAQADAIAYGELFIANPDLPDRIRAGGPFNEPRPEHYYGGTAEGYTDFPRLDG